MDDEKRALAAIKKLALRKLKPAQKKLEKLAKKKVTNTIEDLGMDPEDLQKALGVAETLRSQKLKGKYELGENTDLEGEIDIKKKLIRLGLNHRF